MEKEIHKTKTNSVLQALMKVLVAVGLLVVVAGAIWFISAVLSYFW